MPHSGHRPGPALPRHVPVPHSVGRAQLLLCLLPISQCLVPASPPCPLFYSPCAPVMLWGRRSCRGTEIRLDTISFTHTFWLYSHKLSSAAFPKLYNTRPAGSFGPGHVTVLPAVLVTVGWPHIGVLPPDTCLHGATSNPNTVPRCTAL